jgi:hypothetical protein
VPVIDGAEVIALRTQFADRVPITYPQKRHGSPRKATRVFDVPGTLANEPLGEFAKGSGEPPGET